MYYSSSEGRLALNGSRVNYTCNTGYWFNISIFQMTTICDGKNWITSEIQIFPTTDSCQGKYMLHFVICHTNNVTIISDHLGPTSLSCSILFFLSLCTYLHVATCTLYTWCSISRPNDNNLNLNISMIYQSIILTFSS